GLLMEGFSAERVFDWGTEAGGVIQLVNIGSHIIITFRPEKETVLRPSHTFYQPYEVIQAGMGIRCGKGKIFRTTFWIKAVSCCNGFQYGGFAGAIFTDKNCNLRV